jgi:hypothetical protein
MLRKIGEATRLICTNFVLFGLIILTISLPKNLLLHYGYQRYPERAQSIATTGGLFFAPLFAAALVHALSKLKEGQRPRYSEAMVTAFRKWQKLLAAQLVTRLLVALGLLALVIPGLVFMVRFALLDPVVVLEGAGTATAMSRTEKLTRGRRWQIFFAFLLCLVSSFLLASLTYISFILVPQLDTMAARVFCDCMLDAWIAIPQTVMFLYYCEAVTNERLQIEPPPLPEAVPTLG